MWKYVTAWLYSALCQAYGGQFPFAQPPSLSCNYLFAFFHCAAESGFSSFSEPCSQDFFLNAFFLFTSKYRWASRRFSQCCLIHANSPKCYLRCIGPLLYNVSLTITPKLSTVLPAWHLSVDVQASPQLHSTLLKVYILLTQLHCSLHHLESWICLNQLHHLEKYFHWLATHLTISSSFIKWSYEEDV